MEPRHYQQQSHDAVWDFLRQESGSPLVVLPTGAGKSLVIAMLVEQARAFDARVIVLQHRKELIEQNAEKIQILLPDIKVGINSAGLRRHSFDDDVICAGIQSVYRKAHEFGRRELIIVDEAHLLSSSNDTMYGQFLADIRVINPRARLIGLTATPFRTGEGPICGKNKLFQRICYEAQTGDLINEGFLCPITNKAALAQVDTSGIKTRGSEFIGHDMQRAFDTDDNVTAACSEIVEKCHDRHSVLCFASGVHHAESVAECLRNLTAETVGVVTGETIPLERSAHLGNFRNGQLRWLVNCDVLTTGFDAPCIDAIAVLRATMSPGLFAQIVGRGLRMHELKTECLVLDFGENIKRHGSLDDPEYGRASVSSRGENGGEVAERNGRGKECLNCGIDVAANSRACPDCQFSFPVKHESTADETSALTGEAEPETWDVVSVSWNRHEKKKDPDAPPTLRVIYECRPEGITGNLMTEHISEWVCFEHEGFAFRKAQAWWDAHSLAPFPEGVDDAAGWLTSGAARMPSQITTQKERQWYRILNVEFESEKPTKEVWTEPEPEYQFSFDSDDVPF